MATKTYKIGATVPYCYGKEYPGPNEWKGIAFHNTQFDGPRYDICNGQIIIRKVSPKTFYKAE